MTSVKSLQSGVEHGRSLEILSMPEKECSTTRNDLLIIPVTGFRCLLNPSALVENANPIATRLLPMRRRNFASFAQRTEVLLFIYFTD